ncbi:RICIN domain-containing protein [Streptomyces sp. CB03911]|uniref:RICIN domain-containing protein n=1 Tax=Streptomycetaceae TaxID=2062 RepID=UPI00093D70EF|nr:RICIN domain-containing protein [Streptomyces sp. CB03911]OKI26810.1 beta-xylosidase [Streptomyces sp. CB03911]
MPHKRSSVLLTAALTLSLSLLGGAGAAHAAPVTVTNGTQFSDTTGNPVQAHGGGVIKVGQYYYWFGEDRNADNTFHYVSAYRSTDLKTWEFRNHVLTVASGAELAAGANIERPKVIFNSTTNQFVMWMHKEGSSTDYSEGRVAVATSSTVDGDYSYQGSFRPLGYDSRDMTLYKDDDGTAYLISSSSGNADLHVYRLSADYLSAEALIASPSNGQWREAPALFKRGGVYFLLTSSATGWAPNQQQYQTATSLTGSWSGLQDAGDPTTYRSQTAYVLPVQGTAGTNYLYLGDRWGNSMGGTVNDSQYVWSSLKFPTATTMTMDYSPQVTIDTAAGTVASVGGPWERFTARNSGKCADVANYDFAQSSPLIQWGCGAGANQNFWFKDLGTGYVQIMARHSGRCLDVAGGSTADGAAVVQNTCNGATSQQWKVQKVTGTTYVKLIARHSNKCLDVTNQSTADGTALEQWSCNSGTNQQWQRSTV